MNNKNFRKQIEEDIKHIKSELNSKSRTNNDYYFNHWILVKLFNFDEQVADDYVIDGSDKGIDSYIWFEATKELYLIQAKYYSENTPMNSNYMFDEFFNKPLINLNNRQYKHNDDLQNIFTKYKNDLDFKVKMQLYITTDVQKQFDDKFHNAIPPKYDEIIVTHELFWINDIKSKYFEERTTEKKHFEFQFKTVSDKTILDINNIEQKLNLKLDSKYILAPVYQLFNLVDEASKKNYPLFSRNIREYIGNKGINAGMYNTLKNENDRKNFFYYNNGVTILCKSARIPDFSNSKKNREKVIIIDDPEVVNGAQTVSTIYNVIREENKISPTVKDDYLDSFVMLKVLIIPDDTDDASDYINLSNDIVKYNNSQNAISEKDFASNDKVFINLQKDLIRYGMLVYVKQSDNQSFKERYETKELDETLFKLYDLDSSKRPIHEINLIDLLQVVFAFTKNAHIAKNKKQTLLKPSMSSENKDSDNYSYLMEYLKKGNLTRENIVKLILFYKKAKGDLARESRDGDEAKKYSALHMLDFLRRYIEMTDYKNDYTKFIDEKMESREEILKIYAKIKTVAIMYVSAMINNTHKDFNDISKSKIDEDQFTFAYNNVLLLADQFK